VVVRRVDHRIYVAGQAHDKPVQSSPVRSRRKGLLNKNYLPGIIEATDASIMNPVQILRRSEVLHGDGYIETRMEHPKLFSGKLV
jgi:hypothetical protein